MWLTLLKRFWPYIAGALLLIALTVFVRSYLSSVEQRGYDRAKVEYAIELERDRQHRREVDEETERVHQESLAKVRADASRELRGRSIRCVLGSPGEVRAGQNPGKPAGGAGDEHALRANVDLRPAIVRQGEACEALRQQLMAIRERQEKLAR